MVDNPPMGRAEDIMEDDPFLDPTTELVSLIELSEMIETRAGREVAEDFEQFQLTGQPPQHREYLVEFFRGRNDLLSRSIRQRL